MGLLKQRAGKDCQVFFLWGNFRVVHEGLSLVDPASTGRPLQGVQGDHISGQIITTKPPRSHQMVVKSKGISAK